MTAPAEAVRAAVEAFIEAEREHPPDEPERPRRPMNVEERLAFWRAHGGARALQAAMGGGSRRRYERWLTTTGTERRSVPSKDRRRFQKATTTAFNKTPEVKRYEKDRAEWRRITKTWDEDHPPPELTELLEGGLIVEFAGVVQISATQGGRGHTSIVPGHNRHLQRFAAQAAREDWEAAADELAQAWNDIYGIPARISWVDVDKLVIE